MNHDHRNTDNIHQDKTNVVRKSMVPTFRARLRALGLAIHPKPVVRIRKHTRRSDDERLDLLSKWHHPRFTLCFGSRVTQESRPKVHSWQKTWQVVTCFNLIFKTREHLGPSETQVRETPNTNGLSYDIEAWR